MTRFIMTLGVVLFILCGVARAEVTVEIICDGMATAINADGSVVVGNTEGDYETFMWTEEGLREQLGRATVPVLGSGAGSPDIADAYVAISATILGADSTYGTPGRRVESTWQECMPPTPPDGGLMGDYYGSAWGISGDGEMVVGLYWRPGQPGGSANAFAWTESTGAVGLGSDGGNSRANDADYDGSDSARAVYNLVWANLTLTKSFAVIDTDPMNAGQHAIPGATVEYTLTLVNSGTGAATNIAITDDAPLGTIWGGVQSYTAGTPSWSDPTLTWTINSLPGGDTAALVFDVTIEGP